MCKINGKKLSEIRIEKGISRMELASRIGLSKSSIQKYETGVANPSDKVEDKICMIIKNNNSKNINHRHKLFIIIIINILKR